MVVRLLVLFFFLFSVLEVGAQDAWTQLNDFPETGPFVTSFELLDETYVVKFSAPDEFIAYVYDVNSDDFTFAFTLPISFERLFAFDNKVYGVEWGGDGSVNLWEYDPFLDSLTQKNDVVSSFFTFGFFNPLTWVINGKVFLGLPGNTESGSMFEYDEINDLWLERAPNPSGFDQRVSSFSLDGKAYTIFGSMDLGSEPSYPNLWVYDPIEDSWEEKTAFPEEGRIGSAIFVIGQYVYVGVGATFLSIAEKNFFRYNVDDDTWQLIENPDHFSIGGFSFSIDDIGYFGGGYLPSNGPDQPEQLLSDVWRLEPEFLSVQETFKAALTVYPNPTTNFLELSEIALGSDLKLYDASGKRIPISFISETKINTSSLATGMYFLSIQSSQGFQTLKFIKN